MTNFQEGERVLCYEPDPSMVKVIYDAKILKITIEFNPEKKRKAKHFLVHFQGWSSSWDRYVPQEFLLKDLPENRKLQRQLFDLAEEKRKERKKRKRKRVPEPVGEQPEKQSLPEEEPAGEEVPSVSATSAEEDNRKRRRKVRTDPVEEPCVKEEVKDEGPSESVSDIDEDVVNVPVKIRPSLKRHLEADRDNIVKHHKLNPLPSPPPNIVSVLEQFVRHFAGLQVANHEKQFGKPPFNAYRKDLKTNAEEKLAKARDAVNMAKEVAEGLRIMVDGYAKDVLLYAEEAAAGVYERAMKSREALALVAQQDDDYDDEVVINEPRTAGQVLSSEATWRLLAGAKLKEPLPSMVYGPVYLLRLFCQMPRILGRMNLSVRKGKTILSYMDNVMEFLENSPELFAYLYES